METVACMSQPVLFKKVLSLLVFFVCVFFVKLMFLV